MEEPARSGFSCSPIHKDPKKPAPDELYSGSRPEFSLSRRSQEERAMSSTISRSLYSAVVPGSVQIKENNLDTALSRRSLATYKGW